MEDQKSFLEIVQTEKQLLRLIHSKGITHGPVLQLYRNIRNGYEKILLDSYQIAQLQEIEYHLWKLHYTFIDEFRKRRNPQSSKAEDIEKGNLSHDSDRWSNCEKNSETGFKPFLSEATEFYRDLIMKLRKGCGLPAEFFQRKKESAPSSVEPKKMLPIQYTCHRLFIRLGDIARYTETTDKKLDACDWSTAAIYYLEATRTWPDSGNPHNQLALLSAYVGDSFSAVYHCVRSLAVKERFPDAWRNLVVVFEQNSSSQMALTSCQLEIDFSDPSKRISVQMSAHENGSSNDGNSDMQTSCPEKINVWPIFVRTASFLLNRSSSEEFPCALAAALNSMETLLSLDDAKLTTALESYQYMGSSSRRGPYRAIQLVSIFIFIIHILTENPETEESTVTNDHVSSLTPLAFASIFISMGRITERCMAEDHNDTCPLLPSVLVFVEWLVGSLQTVDARCDDERVFNAMCYFFGALVDLLNRVHLSWSKSDLDYTALWEDHELRGFCHLILVHETLDFSSDIECSNNFRSRNQCRFLRIFRAATRIADRPQGSRKWISYDELETVFSSVEASNFKDQVKIEVEENRSLVKEQTPLLDGIECNLSPRTETTMEEEEVILFRPITRRNSAPVHISNDPICPEGPEHGETPLDECLRRAVSLSVYQNQEDNDSFSFFASSTNSGQSKGPATHLNGPPSLNGWVLGQDTDREKGLKDFRREKLSPIEEIPSSSFSDLSINETKPSNSTTGHISTIVHSTFPYVTPIPSAPLLPDDAVWLRGNPSIFHESKTGPVTEPDGILGTGPANSFAYRPSVRPSVGFVPGFVDGYPPLLGMSSSEWLYHYRNSQNVQNSSIHHIPPIHCNAPHFGDYHSTEVMGFDLYDQWGNRVVTNPLLNLSTPQPYPNTHLVFGGEEQKRDKIFLSYQRPFPYVCGVGMELSGEQPQLLQYLKDKQLQPGSQQRGPFLGN